MRVAFAVPDGQAGFEVRVDAGGLLQRWALVPLSHSPRRALDVRREPCAGVSVGRLMPCLAGPGRLLRVAW
jgi:hypothetical protein